MAEAGTVPAGWWPAFTRDLGQQIEHRGFVLWYLIFERGIKGVVLLVAGGYLAAHVESGVGALANRAIELLAVDSGSNFLKHWLFELLLKFLGMRRGSLVELTAGLLVYGAIELSESVGLILRRRWAEYLVVLATAFFIPIEVRETLLRVTPFRVATLVINIAVVVYLLRRKRLFVFERAAARA